MREIGLPAEGKQTAEKLRAEKNALLFLSFYICQSLIAIFLFQPAEESSCETHRRY
jgi:hypothetical protein